MPTARRSRLISAPAQELWDVICDPHHLPRWWPRVSRVEDVEGGAFTEVLKTDKGKLVRADFALVVAPGGTALQGGAGTQGEVAPQGGAGTQDEAGSAGARRIAWAQQLEGSPFARLLASAETEVWLQERGERTTEVTIELRQTMTGVFPRLGGYMVRRAAAGTLDEALDGLERISTDSGAAGNA